MVMFVCFKLEPRIEIIEVGVVCVMRLCRSLLSRNRPNVVFISVQTKIN